MYLCQIKWKATYIQKKKFFFVLSIEIYFYVVLIYITSVGKPQRIYLRHSKKNRGRLLWYTVVHMPFLCFYKIENYVRFIDTKSNLICGRVEWINKQKKKSPTKKGFNFPFFLKSFKSTEILEYIVWSYVSISWVYKTRKSNVFFCSGHFILT